MANQRQDRPENLAGQAYGRFSQLEVTVCALSHQQKSRDGSIVGDIREGKMPPDPKSRLNADELPLAADSRFAVTLSGGGHRATLFGLGGLMAIVDAGANTRTEQIASVSGGSITNAVVAEACEFQTTTPSDFDPIAMRLFETVIRGVITKPILGVLLAMIFGPVAVFAILALGDWLPPPLITVSVVALWLLVIFFRGIPIETLMDRRYLRVARRRLGTLRDQAAVATVGTDHVFCCTELVSGKPMYFSTMQGGVASCAGFKTYPWGFGWPKNIHDARNVQISAVLRASAGFPGIPPRRFRLLRESWVSSTWPLWPFGSIAFLSDGGVWNNLGTQALLDDGFYRGADKPGVRSSDSPKILLSLDASADLDRTSPWDLHIPGWAEFKALVRQAVISNANTVEPRRKFLEKCFGDAVVSGGICAPLGFHEKIRDNVVYEEVATVIPLSRPPCEVAEQLANWLYLYSLKLGIDFTEFGELDPELWKEVQCGPVEAERVWNALRSLSGRRHVWKRALELVQSSTFEDLCEIGGQPVPADFTMFGTDVFFTKWPLGRPDTTESGLKNIVVTLIEGVSAALRLREAKNDEVRKVPTTLGAIDRATACQLVGRGYANTAISLFMLGLSETLPSPRQYHSWLFKK